MFDNLSWAHILVLAAVGLVILGPERLPGAIRWTAGALRQARDYVRGATSQLREDFGPEFDDLREPISQLQKLRTMSPRAVLAQHLLDGDDSLFTAMNGLGIEQAPERTEGRGDDPSLGPAAASGRSPAASEQPPPQPRAGTQFDSDAT